MVKPPAQVPQKNFNAPLTEVNDELPALIPEANPLKRLVVGGLCITLGLAAAAVGFGSISYRLTHMTVDTGLVNGRTVRLQTPADGTIQDFYARSGVAVQAGQVLARIEPLPENDNNLMQLQQAVAGYETELDAARQSLELLQQQLRNLEQQDQVLKTANLTIATEDINRYQADLEAAIAAERAARSDYERHQQLLSQGAVSQQQVAQLRATWESAQSAVDAAESERNSAQVSQQALTQGVIVQTGTKDLQSQRQTITQAIQEQTVRVDTLEVQLQGKQTQLKELQDRYGDDPSLEIKAPFAGIVHRTERDAGEQVNRPATLLSLLDCNDLWVETLVGLDQANRILTDKPARIQLTGTDETLIGQVELVEAISQGELTKARAEALYPAVPPQLLGQPLARVRVRMPPTKDQSLSYRLCGVGQSAQLTFGMRLFTNRSGS